MREIGSEFHFPKRDTPREILPHLNIEWKNAALCASGRGAIGLALDDMGDRRRALLPDYCCASMIAPFIERGIAVDFYPVNGQGTATIEPDERHDVILLCRYFGYAQPIDGAGLALFRQRGGRVIEDMTHSLLSDAPYTEHADYLVASLRKWAGLRSGGLCAKRSGALSVQPCGEPDAEFLSLRSLAMELKRSYLADGDPAKKQAYLKMFADCERRFAAQTGVLSIDALSRELLTEWDVDAMRAQRRQNASALHEGLKDTSYAPLFSLSEGDCPLFVPILAQDAVARDDLHRRLITRSIYCPIHWPRPDAACVSPLYDRELSLICDGRYDVNDMERILDAIKTK